MDSISQIALGAAVSVAVMGHRTPFGRAALWGAVCGTLPDLDALIDQGDVVRDMTLHRSESHALFYLTLISIPITAAVAKLHGQWPLFRRWWLALFLALVTHPLLDVMTVYGTRLALPFTDQPYGVGSVFIIDPLYTLPLIVGVIAALRWRDARGLNWNRAGLILSTLYLAWGVGVQAQVRGIAESALREQHRSYDRILVTPTAFNSVLWRIVALSPDAYDEAYISLFDGSAPVRFERHARHPELFEALRTHDPVSRLADFSHGFFEMSERDGQVRISDLRMGQASYYFFTFAVATRGDQGMQLIAPEAVGQRPPTAATFRWLGKRMIGQSTAFPPQNP